MDANQRAEEFFAKLILDEKSEIRAGTIFLLASVIHEGMEHQKKRDAQIARMHGASAVAKDIERNVEPAPKPKGILSKVFFWKK